MEEQLYNNLKLKREKNLGLIRQLTQKSRRIPQLTLIIVQRIKVMKTRVLKRLSIVAKKHG